MRRDCAILLGAGISIDAGIPSSFALTRAVYDKLRELRGSKQATLFGYVLAKLAGRRVLEGGTPFDPINIEDAFDALLRLIRKDQDILSEFVYSWDPILDSFRPKFDERAFIKAVADSLRDQRRSINRDVLSIDESHLRRAAQMIAKTVDPNYSRLNAAQVAGTYVDILVSILSSPINDFIYLDDLTKFAEKRAGVVTTLNYDLLFEAAARRTQVSLDYGLGSWNERQVLKLANDKVHLLKLHGSINWSGSMEDFIVSEEPVQTSQWRHSSALMIFGGQSSKLTPHGPFLQLRQAFEGSVMQCNRLLVAGYSFGDDHVNAILNRWISTRVKAKMVILEPSRVDFGNRIFLKSFRFGAEERRKTVQLIHVQKTAKDGLSDALNELTSSIDVKVHGDRDGFLPDILVKKVV